MKKGCSFDESSAGGDELEGEVSCTPLKGKKGEDLRVGMQRRVQRDGDLGREERISSVWSRVSYLSTHSWKPRRVLL